MALADWEFRNEMNLLSGPQASDLLPALVAENQRLRELVKKMLADSVDWQRLFIESEIRRQKGVA